MRLAFSNSSISTWYCDRNRATWGGKGSEKGSPARVYQIFLDREILPDDNILRSAFAATLTSSPSIMSDFLIMNYFANVSRRKGIIFSMHLLSLLLPVNFQRFACRRKTFALAPIPMHRSRTMPPYFVNFWRMLPISVIGFCSERTNKRLPDAVIGFPG